MSSSFISLYFSFLLDASRTELVGLVILAIPVVCTYAFFSWKRTIVQRLPVPPGAEILFGHEKTVFMLEPGRAFRSWINDLGLTFRIKAALRAPDILVLSDPEGISHILQKRIYDYHHSKVVRPRVARLLGKGLGWVEGEFEHKRMKRLIYPSLSSENIKSMSQEVREAASRVVLTELTTTLEGNISGMELNILFWTNRATLNVIGRVAFLHDFEGGNSEDARKILNGRKQGISSVTKYGNFIMLMLLRRFPDLNNLSLPIIKSQSLAKNVIQIGVANEMVNRNASLVADNEGEQQRDLLSRLVRAEADGNLSKEELYEQISTFIISGQETTSQTLAFTIWELARHPDAQRQLRAELESFVEEPTYDDYQKHLPYLDAVLKETLRLYPGLPYMERVATKPDVIPLRFPVQLDNGDEIRGLPIHPGQTILIPIIAIQRLESIWKNADEFSPKRWFEDLPPEEKLHSGWSHMLAFSDGPRSCIGMRLAIFQYKVILSSLVKRFYFEDTGAPISLNIASSLQPFRTEGRAKGPQLPVIIRLI